MHTLRAFAKNNKFALLVAAAWLALIYGGVTLAQWYFGEHISLTAWAGNWDGAWYRSIVEQGYQTGPITHQVNEAFFPLYPLAVWGLATLARLPVIWAGIVVSSFSFVVALVLLHKLVAVHFSRPIANWTLLLIAFNPFSFYFGMMYTESLFLLLATATFWFVLRKEWWRAALFAGLATATRSVGIALAVCVTAALLWREAKKWGDGHKSPGPAARSAPKIFLSGHDKKHFWELPRRASPHFSRFAPYAKVVGMTVLSFSGVIIFSLYLWHQVGDPIAYKHAQEFWPGRGGEGNVINELAYLFAHKQINLEYAIVLMWHVSAVIAFIGVWLLIRMRQRLLTLFAIIALSLPILFGTVDSINRYTLVVFAAFIAFASALQTRSKWLKYGALAACVVGLVLTILLTTDPHDIFLG